MCSENENVQIICRDALFYLLASLFRKSCNYADAYREVSVFLISAFRLENVLQHFLSLFPSLCVQHFEAIWKLKHVATTGYNVYVRFELTSSSEQQS